MRSTRRLLVVAAAILSLAAFAPSASASPRSGDLHVTKECSAFAGTAGGYCTVTSSNIPAIEVGSRIIYRDALVYPVLDTPIVLDLPGPGENRAFGHVHLDLTTGLGTVVFTGGTGKFTWFTATVAVAPNPAEAYGWSWDGAYAFAPAD